MERTLNDPVLVRRALIARLAALGKRIGYLLFLVACVVFVVAFFAGFTGFTVAVIVTCMLVGSALLIPAIIAAYAVKAAEREERGEPSGQ